MDLIENNSLFVRPTPSPVCSAHTFSSCPHLAQETHLDIVRQNLSCQSGLESDASAKTTRASKFQPSSHCHPRAMIPRAGFCADSCSSGFVLNLLLGPGHLASGCLLLAGPWAPWWCLTAPITPFHLSTTPMLLCLTLPPRHRCGFNDNRMCLIGFSPSLAHRPSPRCQPSLPDRTCLVLEDGAGPGTKYGGGPQSRCRASVPPSPQSQFIAACFTPSPLKYVMQGCCSSLLRNSFFFLLLLSPISRRIPVAVSSFSSEISVFNFNHLRRAGRDRECLKSPGPLQAGRVLSRIWGF